MYGLKVLNKMKIVMITIKQLIVEVEVKRELIKIKREK
jgi:hypothetical protein